MPYNLTKVRLITGNCDWQVKAACRGMDVDVFYEADSARGLAKSAQVAHAKAICAICPVSRQCLDQAMAIGETAGVWGGLTTEERDALRRASRHAAGPDVTSVRAKRASRRGRLNLLDLPVT